ncbi:MAG: FG-GAP-like repeat-containing protein, partial [Planctomycetes bacterium]|nr:FG-GAP-like repeat-containing protein [Planctomycetota bacterium]
DAFVGNNEEQNRLYLNGGTGVFTDVTTTNLPALTDQTTAVALGDVDGDGDLDVFVGNDGQSRLYRNGGLGVFTDLTATNLPALRDSTRAVALGDADGDGDPDAFVGNDEEQNRLYLNGGTGVFTDVTGTKLPALLDATQAVALGDVDGDGDLDAFVGNIGEQNRLHINGGTGVFTDLTGTNLPARIDFTEAVALGDVDGDGDPDAFVGNDGEQNRLYLNGGTGVFTDLTATNLPALRDSTRAVALGDVDGDGDLDAFVGNIGGQNRLYSNLTRQLAWRGIPRVGKPLTLDIHGPSWGAWFLGVSLGTANIPIPPLGTLRLDPSSLSFVLGGLLFGDGRASITFSVPASLSLVGIPVYWQAVIVGPARLSNLEITALTDL